MATVISFSATYILPSLVTWFNALPADQRIIKSLDFPFYNVKVVKTSATTTSIIVGDASVGIDSANFVGEATLLWVGSKSDTLPQTATLTSFYEVGKYVPAPTTTTTPTVPVVANLVGMNIFLATDYGVVGGTTIDESDNILGAIAAVGAAGGGHLIIRSQNGTDPIYINKLINIQYNNVIVDFQSDVIYGDVGGIRISGGLAEILRPGQTEKLKLRSASTTDTNGKMVLPLRTGTSSFLRLGDRITVRGQNDKYGNVLEKQTTIVVAITGDDITCADEPDYTFQPTYPTSAWPDDVTTGSTVSISLYTAMTADTTNTDIIPAADTTGFAAGDLVYISDARTEADMMAPVASTLYSAANMEIVRIAAVEGSNLRMERAVRRSYLMSWRAGVVKMAAIKNTHIRMRNVSWVTPQPNRKVHGAAINYGQACTIKIDEMYGRGGRKGIGIRVAYGYDCHVLDSKIYDAYSFLSGEGYGISLYYSTLCSVHNCIAAGNRHNFLLQTATSCDVFDNVSNDDYISGIDLHGAGSVDCRIMRNRVSRSRSYADGVTNGGAIRNGNTAHTIGDHRTLIANNYIEGYLDTKCAAIDVSPASNGVVVRNNDIVDCAVGFRHYKIGSSLTPTQYADRVILDGNSYTRVTLIYDLNNYSNSVISEVFAINERSVDNSAHFLIRNIPKVTIMGAKIIAPRAVAGAYAFTLDGCTDVKIYDCYAGTAPRGFKISNCGTAKLVRNMIGDVTEAVSITDGGGNTSLINLQNTDAIAGSAASGGTVKFTKITGTLAASTTSTDPVNLNTSTPSTANGLTAVAGTVAVTAGNLIDVAVCIPYVSLGGASGPVTAHLFAGGVRVATSVDRMTASTDADNTGGKDVTMVATFLATSASVDFLVKIGPNANTNTIMLNSKFNGAAQPYILVKEIPQ